MTTGGRRAASGAAVLLAMLVLAAGACSPPSVFDSDLLIHPPGYGLLVVNPHEVPLEVFVAARTIPTRRIGVVQPGDSATFSLGVEIPRDVRVSVHGSGVDAAGWVRLRRAVVVRFTPPIAT